MSPILLGFCATKIALLFCALVSDVEEEEGNASKLGAVGKVVCLHGVSGGINRAKKERKKGGGNRGESLPRCLEQNRIECRKFPPNLVGVHDEIWETHVLR